VSATDSPEFAEAVEALEAALSDVLRFSDDGRHLTDWVVLTATQGLDGGDARYSWLLPYRQMQYHVLTGLVRTCLDLIEQNGGQPAD
jgi:hypothetical protein